MPSPLQRLQCQYEGDFYLMDLSRDRFVHFTTRNRAAEIMESGRLLMRPPYKKFGIDATAAVSVVWGSFLPGVQTTHIDADKSDLVGVVFQTKVMPEVGYPEEVLWKQDVVLVNPKVVPYAKAKGMIRGSSDFDGQVYYTVPSWCDGVEGRVASLSSAARVASRYMQAGESFPEMQSAVDRLYENGVIDYPIEVRYFGPIGRGTVEIQLLKEGRPGAFVGHFFTSKVADGWESPRSLRGVSPECLKAYKKIRRKHKGAGLWTVQWAFLKDESLFRQGLGRMVYEKILHDAGRFGAVVAPAWCATGGSTSPMAERVWASVAKRHPTEGPLVVPRNI
jgi:hypothetical protein